MMAMLVGLQGFISLPSFMFVSAVVSDIHELNQNKKEKNFLKTIIFILTPFLGIFLT